MKTLSAPSAPLVRTSAASAAKPHPPHHTLWGAGCGAEACAEIFGVRKMTPELHSRLAEIEAERRRHVDALSCLADEAARIIAEMAGAGPGEPTASNQHKKAEDGIVDNIHNSSLGRPTGTTAAAETPDAPTVANVGHETPDAPSPPIDLDNLASIPQAAAEFGVSDKTLRKWARKHHAIVTIGGRVYADISILTASVISRKVPQISLSIDAPTRKTARRANRKQA